MVRRSLAAGLVGLVMVWPGSSLGAGRAGENAFVNSVGMRFRPLEGGRFRMGSDAELNGSAPSEYGPAHEVTLSPFLMSETEVTVGQFREFVEATGYRTTAEEGGAERNWLSPPFPQTDAHPVVYVSHRDATEFAKWLSQRDGLTYRLPTEAEWEYACRAGSETRYPGGNEPPTARVANLARQGDSPAGTSPVASFPANAFGLYDMVGNVWEWCADWYGAHYYSRSRPQDPPGPDSGEQRCRRGTSFGDDGQAAFSAGRDHQGPLAYSDRGGFRLARRPDPARPEGETEARVTLRQGLRDYYGCADTWVNAREADANYGGHQNLTCDSAAGIAAMLRFDVSFIPKEVQVRSAELSLWSLAPEGGDANGYQPSEVGVRLCRGAWVEGAACGPDLDAPDGATFRTGDGATPWKSAGGDIGSPVLASARQKSPGEGYLRWSISPIVVENWIAGRMPNYGFVLLGGPGWPNEGVLFASSDNAKSTRRPTLELVLSIPPQSVEEYRTGMAEALRRQQQEQAARSAARSARLAKVDQGKETENDEGAEQREPRDGDSEVDRREADKDDGKPERRQAKKESPRAKGPRGKEEQQRTELAKLEEIVGRPLHSIGRIGEDVLVGTIRWKVVSAEDLGSHLKCARACVQAKTTTGRFVCLTIEVENVGKEAAHFREQYIYDKSGRRYSPSYDLRAYFPPQTVFLPENFNPKVPQRYVAVYEVPRETSGFVLTVSNLARDNPFESAIRLGS